MGANCEIISFVLGKKAGKKTQNFKKVIELAPLHVQYKLLYNEAVM